MRALGLERHVRFVGYAPRMAEWYAALDLVVLASTKEGLALMVLAEALLRIPDAKLIDIADENEMTMAVDGAEQIIHERQIHHRGLIDDHYVGLQRSIFAPLKAAFMRVVFEQPVNCHRFFAGAFSHTLGGPSGGRGENERKFRATQ